MPPARTVAVVTGSRADYGHLTPVMRAIAATAGLKLRIIACGQQVDPRFGDTWRAIVDDGFTIDLKVDYGLTDDSPLAITHATGRGVIRMAEALALLKPDIVLALGDRYEILAAGIAALLGGIPIAHLHGGELTEGAVDDAIRHSLTKMAALHFAAAEPYAARLRQMGEDPARVHMVGAPILDAISKTTLMDRSAVAAELGLDLSGQFLVVTYHPVTRSADLGRAGLTAILAGLGQFPDAAIVFTGVNSDAGHSEISRQIAAFVSASPSKRKMAESLGQRRYFSAVKAADAVVGNSSSGLLEAPALGTPTVNIGDRQKGRLRSGSVIDCAEDAAAIATAITRALDPAFRAGGNSSARPYGAGGASARIAETLKSVDLAQLSRKRFHDIIGA